jgi:signal transduction histidine kinase
VPRRGLRRMALGGLAALSVTTAAASVGFGQGVVTWPWVAAGFVTVLITVGVVGYLFAVRATSVVGVFTAVAIVAPATVSGAMPVAVGVVTIGHIAVAAAFGQLLRVGASDRAAARREAQERAVWQERLRIARDMHDVLAHRLSLIALQAEAAVVQFPELDPSVQERFEMLRSTAAQGLREMRSVLWMLREPRRPTRQPVPGLAAIDGLIEEHRSAGVIVRTTPDFGGAAAVGAADRLSPTVAIESAAFRTVQEALSNAVRHGARHGPVDVELTRRGDELLVRVGSQLGSHRREDLAASGLGLRGMRERVEAVGGSLIAGPVSADRFSVTARFPIPADESGGP